MALGVTKSLLDWTFQKTHIERNMDSAAYEAAHPDDTLVLAGPARANDIDTAGAGGDDVVTGVADDAAANNVPLLPIGMVQALSFTQSKPTQPMMAIGSGRSFFTSGKAQTQWQCGRLFVNGRNLLRVLYQNSVHHGLDVSQFDDPAAHIDTAKFFTNLDSELYYMPFGLAVLFRNKMHDWVGAFYAELCMINSYSIGVNAGQSVIMENVSGVCDRMLPLSLSNVSSSPNVARETVDRMIGFVSSGSNTPSGSAYGNAAGSTVIG